jgi:hypothetical protein
VRPQDDRLRTVLREEAGRHLPDHDAMLARVNRRRGSTRRRLTSFLFQPVGPGARRVLVVLRPVAAAAAVAGVLIAAIVGTTMASRGPGPDVAGPPVSPEPSATASTGPAGTGTPSPALSKSPTTTGPPVRDGYLTATVALDPYSISSWSQTDLTLATTEEITALDVTLRVARTPGVADTGHWSSIPVELIASALTSSDTELIYHFTLNPGARLAPGSYVFAAQFNHDAAPRPVVGDRYAATATAAATGAAHLTGGFTGQPG